MRRIAPALTAALLVGLFALVAPGCGSDEDDCAKRCREGTGGPPTNDCKNVNGDEMCIKTCSGDSDCTQPFWQTCSGKADDGTKICCGNNVPCQ